MYTKIFNWVATIWGFTILGMIGVGLAKLLVDLCITDGFKVLGCLVAFILTVFSIIRLIVWLDP